MSSSCAQLPLCRQGICLCREETPLQTFPLIEGSPFYHHPSGTDYIVDPPWVVKKKMGKWNRKLEATARQHQLKYDVAVIMSSMLPDKTVQHEVYKASSTLMMLKNPNRCILCREDDGTPFTICVCDCGLPTSGDDPFMEDLIAQMER